MTPNKARTFRIDEELIEGMDAVKERDGVSLSEQVRRAIRMWLDAKGVVKKTGRKRVVARKRP